MDLFTYLMSKKGQNTQRDLFSYLLGKGSGGGGKYTTYTGTSLNISNTIKAAIKKFMLNPTELTQDGTPTPDTPQDIHIITGSNNIKITDGVEEQNYSIDLRSDNLFNKNAGFTNGYIDNSGNLIVALNNALMKGYIKVKPNTTYMISQDISIYSIGICLYNETTFIERMPQILDTDHRTFTTNGNTNQIRLFINLDNKTSMTQSIIDNLNIQLNEGNVIKPYTPYYNIEYCKIRDYRNQIFKNTIDSEFYDSTLLENEWYLKKKIGKIDSYNGETIATPYISTTGGLDTGATIYYGLATPQYIHISQEDYPILRSQLENLYNNAKSYNGTTNITQTNDDLPFNISVDVKVS